MSVKRLDTQFLRRKLNKNISYHFLAFRILKYGLKVFAGNKSFGIDSEIGVLSYLSYVQERHMKVVLKEMVQISLYENPAHKQPEVSTIPYLLHLCGKSEVILQQLVPVLLELRESMGYSVCIESALIPLCFHLQIPTNSLVHCVPN